MKKGKEISHIWEVSNAITNDDEEDIEIVVLKKDGLGNEGMRPKENLLEKQYIITEEELKSEHSFMEELVIRR